MATHKSALKRHRQSLKRRERNRVKKAEIRTLKKKLAAASKDEAPALMKKLQSKVDKAGHSPVMHRKAAAKIVSKAMRAVAAKFADA